MKNSIDLRPICQTQGRIFKYVAEQYKIADFCNFVKNYMLSNFCNITMDSLYAYEQLSPVREIRDEIDPLMKPFSINNKQYNPDTAYWMGYMYRYVSRKYNIPSKDLYSWIPFSKMLEIVETYDYESDIHEMEERMLAIVRSIS